MSTERKVDHDTIWRRYDKLSRSIGAIAEVAVEHRAFGGHRAVGDALDAISLAAIDLRDAAIAGLTELRAERVENESQPAARPSETVTPLTREELDALASRAINRHGYVEISRLEFDGLLATARQGLADTERLDWFDRMKPFVHHIHSAGQTQFSVEHSSYDCGKGATIREAIDAYRAFRKEKDGRMMETVATRSGLTHDSTENR